MCSRHTLHHPVNVLANYFGVTGGAATSDSFTPNYNIAPSHSAIVIVRDGVRQFVNMAAGLLSPEDERGKRHINARAETADQLVTFRTAFRKRRCLIPMSGFYEPDHVTNSKEPYYFCMANDRPFVCAGIYDVARSSEGVISSYAIITVPANKTISAVHDRMPAILNEAEQEQWLDPAQQDTRSLKRLLHPYSGDDLLIRRVHRSLYRNTSTGSDCIAPYRSPLDEPNLFTGLT